jgi:hypothetical protein
MGGGKDQKDANNMIRGGSAWENSQRDTSTARNEQDLSSARGKSDELYNTLKSGYSSLLTPAQAAAQGGGGGAGPAATADPRFGDVQSMYTKAMQTGGLDPAKQAAMEGDITKLRGIGYDPETVARIRGNGVFDEFAKTGGISDADRGNIRSRANSVIPSVYSSMQQGAKRQGMVQGGYGPGQSALMARMGRGQAGAMADTARDTELGIMGQVNAGRQWGAGNVSDAERGLSSLRSDTTQAAMGGERGLAESIRQGQQWGTAGTEGRAESDRSYQAQQAAASAANSRYASESELRQKMMGLEGLQSLYGASPNEYMQYKDFDLGNRGLTNQSTLGFGGGLKTGNRSPWDTVGQIAGGAAGGFI